MANRTLVIVNPRSRNGATGRRWRRVERRLADALGPFEVERTTGPRDAERIAREGVRAGIERLVVAGGDGTLSEVVTGLLGADLGGYAEIGVLPLGTGGDFGRTLGLPRDLDGAIRCLAAGHIRRIDAGRVRYHDAAGLEATAYFLNVTSLGISGLVTELANRGPKALGGLASFLVATLRSILSYSRQPVCLRVDGREVHRGPLVLAAVANGRCFGGGMRVAPDARPDDGLFDVVVVGDVPTLRLLGRLLSLYRGTHLALDGVSLYRGTRLEADAEPGRVWLEVDGEPLGCLPARIDLLPGAVSLVAPG